MYVNPVTAGVVPAAGRFVQLIADPFTVAGPPSTVHVGVPTLVAAVIMNFSGHEPAGPDTFVGAPYVLNTEVSTDDAVPVGIGCVVAEKVPGTADRIPLTIAWRAIVAPESAA